MIAQTTPRSDTLTDDTVSADSLLVPHGKKGDIFSSFTANAIAGVSALGAALLNGRRIIEERVHKNMGSLFLGDDIKKERVEYGIKLREQVKSGELSAQQAYEGLKEGIHSFEDKFDERFGKAGVKTTRQKWGLLRNHQKWEVAFSTAASLGIVFGSVLLVSRDFFFNQDGTPTRDNTKKDNSTPADGIQR
jgi:hypothetical protein